MPVYTLDMLRLDVSLSDLASLLAFYLSNVSGYTAPRWYSIRQRRSSEIMLSSFLCLLNYSEPLYEHTNRIFRR